MILGLITPNCINLLKFAPIKYTSVVSIPLMAFIPIKSRTALN